MKIACPRCGANVSFMPSTQKCYCEYCGNQIDIAEFELKEFEKEEKSYATKSSYLEDFEGLHIENEIKTESIYDEYVCSSCGARLITDETTTITDCVYCGSRQILKGKMQGEFKPKEILPFKIDRNQFISMYTTFVRKKILAPEEFKNNSRLMETKGIYIPFHLFFYEIDSYARGEAMQQTKDNTSYKYFEMDFSTKLLAPQDASTKFNDDIMTSLEPFNFNELTLFNPVYLNGFLAENGNENLEQLERKAEARGINEIKKNIYTKTKQHSFSKGQMKIDFKKLEERYVLLPVWFINTWYNNKLYSYAVNGQTGKVVGEIPLSKPKFFALMAVLCSIAVILTFAILIASDNVDSDSNDSIGELIGGIWGLVIAAYVFIKKRYKNVNAVLENPLNLWDKKENLYKEYSKKQYKKTFGENDLEKADIQLYRNGVSVKALARSERIEELKILAQRDDELIL